MKSDKKKIIAVFKTHFDYGYTDRKENVLRSYCEEKLERALRVCEATQRYGEKLSYKWTICSFLLMKMYHNASEENRNRMVALIRKGQIACHALPFTMHTTLLDRKLAENMFIWTDEYVEKFQKPFPIAAKMTDVPGHTSGIIEPLVKRGVKFLHLGKNGASLAPAVPMLFWWEDVQGNRILTMYNRDYGSDLKPPKNWKYPVWLAFCHTYDNVGVQNEEYILDIAEQAMGEYEFQTGTLDDFAQEILQCDLSDLPIIRGDLSDTWIHGIGSYPDAVAWFRQSKTAFYELESQAKEKGLDISEERRAFYENALIYTEHTFGINVLKYFPDRRVYDKKTLKLCRKQERNYKFAETSWEDEKAFASNMREICRRVSERLGTVEKNKKTYPLDVWHDGKYVYFDYLGKRIKLYYEYCIFGSESVHSFTKKYLTRFTDWSISDFGKLWYPEISDRKYIAKIVEIKQNGNEWEVLFKTDFDSRVEFGNFARYFLKIKKTDEGVEIAMIGKDKEAVGFVEAGNFIVDIGEEGHFFAVEQIGKPIDVNRDIVRNSNQVLWCMDRYAMIDGIKLYSYDAPLVSFERNAICRYNGGKKRKKKSIFVVNLFNNHWGTNFPQWLEGNYEFRFLIRSSNEN